MSRRRHKQSAKLRRQKRQYAARLQSTTEGRLRRMIENARHRAKRKDIPCTITLEDIWPPPVKCPLLGIVLVYTHRGRGKPDSPSLDQIIPGAGYTPENVMIVSARANTLKNNATLDELLTLAQNLKKIFNGRK